MAKMSAYTSASALNAADTALVVQSGSTRKPTMAQIKDFCSNLGTAVAGIFTTLTASTSVTTPIIDSGSAGSILLKTNSGSTEFEVAHKAGVVINWIRATGATGAEVVLDATGSSSDIAIDISSKGTAAVNFGTNANTVTQFQILHTGSANRNITVTGSNGANPTINTTAGNLAITPIVTTANKIYPGTDAAAAQTASGLYAGTGAPNNANGSNGDIYFRSDGGALSTVYQRRAGAWVGIV